MRGDDKNIFYRILTILTNVFDFCNNFLYNYDFFYNFLISWMKMNEYLQMSLYCIKMCPFSIWMWLDSWFPHISCQPLTETPFVKLWEIKEIFFITTNTHLQCHFCDNLSDYFLITILNTGKIVRMEFFIK